MITPPIKRLPGGYEAARLKGWGAHNTMFGVSIHRGLDVYAGILAQEVYEWRYKWLVGLALAAPIVALAVLLWTPTAALLGGLAAAVALIANVRLVPPLHARMELVSHAIESVIAASHYGKKLHAYLASEALIMARHYKQFDGWEASKVYERMDDYLPKAREWAKRHDKWIARHQIKGNIAL